MHMVEDALNAARANASTLQFIMEQMNQTQGAVATIPAIPATPVIPAIPLQHVVTPHHVQEQRVTTHPAAVILNNS